MKKFFLVALIFLSFIEIQAQEQKWLLNSNMIQGTWSSELHTVLNDVVVQRALLDIASSPRTKEYIDSTLQKTNYSLTQLLKLKLIRRQKDIYVINYLLFTAIDLHLMREITESNAQMLANALLKHRAEIETILKPYELSDVDPYATLFIILGCFSLDWDGLALTAERGYRLNGNNDTLSIVTSEECIYDVNASSPTLSRKEFYKGSHNETYGIATLTSFGDHAIQPRKAFPDVLWQIEDKVTLVNYPDSLKSRIHDLVNVSINEIGEHIGLIMLALRDDGKTLAELAEVIKVRQDNAERLLDLMMELGYIKQNANHYQSCIPVLALRDSSIVKQIRRIGRETMEKYFDSNYEQLHKDLSELTPFRYGLEQNIFFYSIWHDIFGATNRILVKEGLFADPYSKVYGSKGIIPVVFHSSLRK